MLEFLKVIVEQIINHVQGWFSVWGYLISFSNSLMGIFLSAPPFLVGILEMAIIVAVLMWIINIF